MGERMIGRTDELGSCLLQVHFALSSALEGTLVGKDREALPCSHHGSGNAGSGPAPAAGTHLSARPAFPSPGLGPGSLP